MSRSLTVTISCEGRVNDKRSTSLELVGAVVQELVDSCVHASDAFDDITVAWEQDEDA